MDIIVLEHSNGAERVSVSYSLDTKRVDLIAYVGETGELFDGNGSIGSSEDVDVVIDELQEESDHLLDAGLGEKLRRLLKQLLLLEPILLDGILGEGAECDTCGFSYDRYRFCLADIPEHGLYVSFDAQYGCTGASSFKGYVTIVGEMIEEEVETLLSWVSVGAARKDLKLLLHAMHGHFPRKKKS